MTKEITKAIILQEMQDKLKMRDFTPAAFLFDETVVPVYDIEQHLKTWTIEYFNVTPASIGGKNLAIVPKNERWEVAGYTLVFMGAATLKISGIYIARLPEVSRFVYLDLTAGQVLSYTNILPKMVTLNPGDLIGVNVDEFTSSVGLRLYVDFRREEIR